LGYRQDGCEAHKSNLDKPVIWHFGDSFTLWFRCGIGPHLLSSDGGGRSPFDQSGGPRIYFFALREVFLAPLRAQRGEAAGGYHHHLFTQ
jgi:hypothetical protein